MPVLAQINIAKMRAPITDALMLPFASQVDAVNQIAEQTPGFVWRLKDESNSAVEISKTSPFGVDHLVNLSVWQDAQALKNFVYRQPNHAELFRNKSDWFIPMQSPHFVMWWLAEGEQPNLIDAQRRLNYLKENGDSPYAFTFNKLHSAEQSIAAHKKIELLVQLADDALIHSQRIAEWCGHGPILEEDLALGNIALDYLGQARWLYSLIARTEGKSRTEDDLAFFRRPEEFLNHTLVELPNNSLVDERDYATTITKLFLHSAFMLLRWRALRQCNDTALQAIAEKSLKEVRYHFDHAKQWMIRFGDGTEESRRRLLGAMHLLMPYSSEFFVDSETDKEMLTLLNLHPPSTLTEEWNTILSSVCAEATIAEPAMSSNPASSFLSKGKFGYHSESFSYLIGEMQSLARQHPGAIW